MCQQRLNEVILYLVQNLVNDYLVSDFLEVPTKTIHLKVYSLIKIITILQIFRTKFRHQGLRKPWSLANVPSVKKVSVPVLQPKFF